MVRKKLYQAYQDTLTASPGPLTGPTAEFLLRGMWFVTSEKFSAVSCRPPNVVIVSFVYNKFPL